MSASFFIAGTGTGAGKTLVTAALAHQLTRGGYSVAALKPVVSGFAYDDLDSDPAVLLQSMGKPVTPEAINAIAPWRFAAPLSPHMAAWKEGAAPRAREVAEFCRAAVAERVLAESAGGIMTPLNDHETMLDICTALGWPVILVSGSALGALSHTLTALKALASAGARTHAVIISESEEGVSLADTAQSIRLFAPAATSVYTVPRISSQEHPWKHLPDLTALCL